MTESRVPAPPAPTEEETGLTRRGIVGKGALVLGGAVVAGGLTGAAAAGASGPAAVEVAPAPGSSAKTVRIGPGGLPRAEDLDVNGQRLVDFEVLELASLFRAGKTTSVAVTQAYLDRIMQFNGPFETYGDNGLYNAFIRIDGPGALKMAAAADARLATERGGGAPAPYLCGIPMGFKDSIGVKGFKAQDGSTAFTGNMALSDGAAVGRLRAQGVVILGITICSEFSGSVSGTFAGNAWNKDHVPGGSSQGSGVATAARLAAACLGEETGGSITFPSACNGASGIKPSLGLSSVDGVMPLTPGTDVIGPIARSGADAAVVLNAMLGPDGDHDVQTLAAPQPFPQIPFTPRPGSQPLKGTTIGIPKTDWLTVGVEIANNVDPQSLYSPEHALAFNRLKTELQGLGATVIDIQTPDIEDVSVNPYFSPRAATSTAQPTLATVDGTAVTPLTAIAAANRCEIKYVEAVKAFAATVPATQSAALVGNYGRAPGGSGTATFDGAITFNAGIPAGARREAELRRRTLAANFAKALHDVDCDFLLFMQCPADVPLRTAGVYSLSRAYYQLPNAISWPLVSFPIALSQTGLPICAQFWGPRFAEPELVQAMIDYQARYPQYHKMVPPDPTASTPLPISQLGTKETAASRALFHNDPVVTDQFLKTR